MAYCAIVGLEQAIVEKVGLAGRQCELEPEPQEWSYRRHMSNSNSSLACSTRYLALHRRICMVLHVKVSINMDTTVKSAYMVKLD